MEFSVSPSSAVSLQLFNFRNSFVLITQTFVFQKPKMQSVILGLVNSSCAPWSY